MLLILLLQTVALLVLLRRLARGRDRVPPIAPSAPVTEHGSVSVIVPTMNEAMRIEPCVRGLTCQQAPLLETLVIDSHSIDGTRQDVDDAALRDPRIRFILDPPRPEGWIGKVWALQ